tara:strand:+ start:1438 stop:3483 length:2046 start_codon:yes stop_codon:yes gene_type:complete
MAYNTSLVKRINLDGNFVKMGNIIYFPAKEDYNVQTQLWKTDGTEDGTEIVKIINSTGSSISELIVFKNEIFFAANNGFNNNGKELWKSDGTENGTIMLKDIYTGGNSFPSNFKIVGDILFFTADNGNNGFELWKTDGTSDGTVMVKDINSGSSSTNFRFFAVVNNILFFSANNQLWKSNGEESGTVIVKDSEPFNLIEMENKLYFFINNDSSELWESDGTEDGTNMIKNNFTVQKNPDKVIVIENTLFFLANDGTNGYELWKTDGTSDNTIMVKDINTGNNNGNLGELVSIGNLLFFLANDGVNGQQLWKSNGTSDGTVMVKYISSNSNLGHFTEFQNILFFVADDGVNGSEIWRSDGSEDGTYKVTGINNNGGSNPYTLTSFGDTLIYGANDGNNPSGSFLYQIWKIVATDNTSPTVSSFTISDTFIEYNETATVTLIFSEAVTGFSSNEDVVVQNGNLSLMTSSDNITWTGTFTATENIKDTSNVITLLPNYTDQAGNTGISATTENYIINNICFPKGTPITTDQGNISIESINTDIHTIRGNKIITITESNQIHKNIVCIEKDSICKNVPSKKTIISNEHCVYYQGVMIKAKELVKLCDNVHFIDYNGETLYNVLLEEHNTMLVNNLICETLHPDNVAAKISKIKNKFEKDKVINELNKFLKNRDFIEYQKMYYSLN